MSAGLKTGRSTIETHDKERAGLRLARRLQIVAVVLILFLALLDPPVTIAGRILTICTMICIVFSAFITHQKIKQS